MPVTETYLLPDGLGPSQQEAINQRQQLFTSVLSNITYLEHYTKQSEVRLVPNETLLALLNGSNASDDVFGRRMSEDVSSGINVTAEFESCSIIGAQVVEVVNAWVVPYIFHGDAVPRLIPTLCTLLHFRLTPVCSQYGLLRYYNVTTTALGTYFEAYSGEGVLVCESEVTETSRVLIPAPSPPPPEPPLPSPPDRKYEPPPPPLSITTRVTMPGAFFTSGIFLCCGCFAFMFNRRGGGQRSKWPENPNTRIFDPQWGVERSGRADYAHRGHYVPQQNTALYVSLGTGKPERSGWFTAM